MRWAWVLFGILFLASAVVCFADPTDTFAGLADMLGFLFLIVGIWWMVRAFLDAINPQWWLGLISGILMTGLAFWTSGQFFIHKAYVLLVFAGIWALMQGMSRHRPGVLGSGRARRAVTDEASDQGRPAGLPPPPRRAELAGRT